MKKITSTQNPYIKQIVELKDAIGRQKYGLCIVEGERAVRTFLEAGQELVQLYLTDFNKWPDKQAIHVSPTVMKKISSVITPSGILGVFKIPKPPATLKAPGVVLAQISDPGNMGTLIRTAAALGLKTVVIVEGADPWSPKVIQASAGTIAKVHIFSYSWQEFMQHKGTLLLYAMIVKSGQSLQKIKTKNTLFVIGSEAHGLPKEWEKECDMLVTLPMPGGTESLNAAVAGSIALYITYGLK